MALTNEQILEEIRVAMRDNSDTKRKINEALTHAQTAIQNMEKRLQAEYERGLNDGWNAAKKVVLPDCEGGLSVAELEEIFNTCSMNLICLKVSGKEAVEKIKAYEEKKNKLTKGDEVVVHCLYDSDMPDEKAIFFSENDGNYFMLFPGYRVVQIMPKKDYTLTKTGRHVDIFGDEKGER